GPLFTDNGYNGWLAIVSDNPLEGRSAFIAASYGYTASRIGLSSLAGNSVRFRFRLATDFEGDAYGWFIDDIRIYTCAGATPSENTVSVTEGEPGESYTVVLTSQPSSPVTITLSTGGQATVSPASL